MFISPPILLPRNLNEHEDAWIDRCMTGDAPGRGAYPLSHELEWHGGLHLTAPRSGTKAAEICAVADGKVVFIRHPEVVPASQQDHPLNYFDGYTSDACMVLQHCMAICPGETGSFTFYSVYHHLTGLNEKLAVGATVRRRDPIGRAGCVYAEPDRFHFEICCDDANLKKLVGRTSGALTTLADGRADIVFGEMYFIVPSGTPVYANEPAHFRADGFVQPVATKASSALPPAQPQTAASSTATELIVGVRTDRWLGSVPGAPGTTTYRQDGSELGSVADSESGSTLPLSAARIVAAWKSAQKANPAEYRAIPDLDTVLQLLRYGRATGQTATPLTPASAPHWRRIKHEGGEGWINLNADNIRKCSDADFPHWKGWLLVDDDSAASDCKCDSAMIKKILGGGASKVSGMGSPDAARNDPAVACQLKKTICKFPCEWEAKTLEARWSWLKSVTSDNPTPLNESEYKALMDHLKALCFECPELFAAQWRFEPREFIKMFRRCGWASASHRIRKAIATGTLPDADGLSDELKADMYTQMLVHSEDFLKSGDLEFAIDVRAALESHEAIEFGLRIPTPPSARGGRGDYDDRMVVLQLDAQDVLKILAETYFNADPAGSYQEGKPRPTYWGVGRTDPKPQPDTPDANLDGVNDLGRLHQGIYKFEWNHSDHKGPNIHVDSKGAPCNVLKPTANVPTDRYFEGSWHFNSSSFIGSPIKSPYSGRRTVLQHEGYGNFTGSAGCQTFPKDTNERLKHLSFKDFTGKLARSNQNEFIYLLRDL